ncbi:hypothetical protein GOBAR_AA38931 [Gossypium barbadense]|uniref:PB1-like domain-containing protein n=1 Tax=Gossypium barbadense TaxID=3634 RepID=A0A2P5VSH4_GOSBA|nr:hypothetical protein GOBAR_DD00332 [Gossypium barbadense]PPR81778.1 hypothetical protein GOBAR_AA38931 [Gossypium barbadense]
MSWGKCVVHVHLGGTFVSNPCASYVGGEVLQWDFDFDFFCYYMLCEMVVEAGYRAVRNFVYSKGKVDFSKGMCFCYDNSSFTVMINHIRQRETIHVYVDHKVDTPDVVDDTMLLLGSREKDVNNGVGVGEQNYNKRVNSGAGETFTELGGESNVGLDFSGSSDTDAEGGESTKSSGANDTDNLLGSEGALGIESEDDDEENKRASYKFVEEHFLSKIRLIPKLKLTEMQKLAKEELKVELSRGTCSRARK